MMLILAIVIGAAIGWFAAQSRAIPANPVFAAAIGGFGGFVGGLALKLILPIAFALLGALVGAAILLIIFKMLTESRN